jgi:type IV secretion system protein VirB10
VVKAGTRILLALNNSVSTKRASPGDRVYFESVFPVMEAGKIVIPAGSHVSGTVTKVKRPGRVKGRGALYVRFDSMILPNGVTRDFQAHIAGLVDATTERLEYKGGKIVRQGNKKGDAKTVGEAASVGSIAGLDSHGPLGDISAVAAVVGAVTGMGIVLAAWGPNAVLAQGTRLDVVLDRDLTFSGAEIPSSGIANWIRPEPAEDLIGALVRRKNRVKDVLDPLAAHDQSEALQKLHSLHLECRQAQRLAESEFRVAEDFESQAEAAGHLTLIFGRLRPGRPR